MLLCYFKTLLKEYCEIIFSVCVLSLSGLLECCSAFGGEKEFRLFSLFSGKTVQKLCLSFFQDVFYKQRQPIKIICISVVGDMIVFRICEKINKQTRFIPCCLSLKLWKVVFWDVPIVLPRAHCSSLERFFPEWPHSVSAYLQSAYPVQCLGVCGVGGRFMQAQALIPGMLPCRESSRLGESFF